MKKMQSIFYKRFNNIKVIDFLNKITFNEDQIDALREFINISLGEATSHVAES